MTAYVVSSGVTSSGINLYPANPGNLPDTMDVLSGGTAVDTTVFYQGFEEIESGGSASGTTLHAGGYEAIAAGGSDTGALITSDGVQQVFGYASGATVYAGGSQIVSSGGIADGTIGAGGTIDVKNGGEIIFYGANVPTGTVLEAGAIEAVGSGGNANGIEVTSGITFKVQSGATASNTQIDSGRLEIVSSGGSDFGASISGKQDVYGYASGATVYAGGSEVVERGGVADGTVGSGGTQSVYGTASSTLLDASAVQYVESGGVASGTIIEATDTEIVLSGGTTIDTVISDGTLDVQSGGIVSGSVTFSGTGGTYEIEDSGIPGAVVSGFVSGDRFALSGIGFDPSGHADLTAGNVLVISENGNTYEINLDPTQSFTGDYFHLSSNADAITIVTEDNSPCYCRGTRILTPEGEVPVEELAIGDNVTTLSGAAKRVRWIGHRAYDGRFITGNRQVLPIRIAAGAIGNGIPARDLWVSPGHAMYIDGVLVQSEHLVNGMTIAQAATVDAVEYFHIELDEHDVVFAEGAPAESFVDCDNRLMFKNGAEYAVLYPDDSRPSWDFCAPRLEWGADELTAIRARLLARAEQLGFTLVLDPDLHLEADGEILRPMSQMDTVLRFEIPAGIETLWLASRIAVPAETVADSRDIRPLGVPVERIVLSDGNLSIEGWHGQAALCDGFHDDEPTHRWTNGRARLPENWLRLFPGEVTLELHLFPSELRYPVAAPIANQALAAAASAPQPKKPARRRKRA